MSLITIVLCEACDDDRDFGPYVEVGNGTDDTLVLWVSHSLESYRYSVSDTGDTRLVMGSSSLRVEIESGESLRFWTDPPASSSAEVLATWDTIQVSRDDALCMEEADLESLFVPGEDDQMYFEVTDELCPDLIPSGCPTGNEQCSSDVTCRAESLVSGGDTGCALLNDGTAACWGRKPGETPVTQTIARLVPGMCSVVGLGVGRQHLCGWTPSGTVSCWGDNLFFQLGSNDLESTLSVEVEDVADALEVVAGSFHTCARTANGGVLCWGENGSGQLGNGETSNARSSPQSVESLSDAEQLSSLTNTTCAIRGSGEVACWGENGDGQAGGATNEDRLTPGAVIGLNDVTDIAVGSSHSCAISAGLVHCWGSNELGQLGLEDTTAGTSSPQQVPGLAGATQLASGMDHSCALVDGAVLCWGNNQLGQLGLGSDETGGADGSCDIFSDVSRTSPPSTVVDVTDVMEIASGYNHTCVLLQDREVRCWGDSRMAQLGDESGMCSDVPLVVASFE